MMPAARAAAANSAAARTWLARAAAVRWAALPTSAVCPDTARWFPGGRLNLCFNAVDRHLEAGRASMPAILYDSPVTAAKRRVSYADLHARVNELAALLKSLGVGKGDTALIYMPNVPEAQYAMLACARLGVVHSVVFGGFAASELAKRIGDCAPKIVLSASCGVEGPTKVVAYKPIMDAALRLVHGDGGRRVYHVVLQRDAKRAELDERKHEYDWRAAVGAFQGSQVPCAELDSRDPLYILYTSGTTGMPKGIVRDTGGYTAALAWSIKAVYDINEGDVMFSSSDVGWVLGHSYMTHAPLIGGAATVLYEGKPIGTPDAGVFWRIIQEYGVKTFFCAPTAMRAIKREDPHGLEMKKYDLSTLKHVFFAGERSDTDTISHFENMLGGIRPTDHWWQTELGWPVTGLLQGESPSKNKIGSAGRVVPTHDLRVLREAPDGQVTEAPPGELGTLAIKLPLAPGIARDLWGRPGAFEETYLSRFPGYYDTSDYGLIDEDGFVFVMGRTDDIMNVAGHRISTGSIEEAICHVPAVAECAVVSQVDQLKGELPVAFVALKVDADAGDVSAEAKRVVREHVGAFACLNTVYVTKKLPKTRSGKILRRTLRSIVNGEKYDVPATIEDPAALAEIESIVKAR